METIDVIKKLCKEKNITLSQLESELDYGNGSIAKSKGNMSADRMFQIAKYFKVPMEYLMTGNTVGDTDDEIAIIRQQQSILLDISKYSQTLSDAYKTIDTCKDELAKLRTEYNKLEAKKRKELSTFNSDTDVPELFNQFWQLPFDTLPFDDTSPLETKKKG